MLDGLMTASELARYLKLELRTVYRYLKDGHLPAIRVGGQWRFRKREIDQWLLQRVLPVDPKPHRPRLLVVDDDVNVRKTLLDALEFSGYNAQGAEDGEAALALLREAAFDLLLVDLKMPGVDGIELIRRAKSLHPQARIIILTGYGTKETAIEALNLGVLAYLEKPIRDLGVLESAVERVLTRKP